MLIRVLVVSTIAAGILVPVQAQRGAELSPPPKLSLQQWPDEEVQWIITDAERRAYQKLENDLEREMFINIFWLRRDPTPDTGVNEFREEHYRRLQWSNDRLGGWKTDRGMVYVKFGAPDAREESVADATGSRSDKWTYKFLEGIGQDVVLEFVDPGNANEFKLSAAGAERDALMRAVPATIGNVLQYSGRPFLRRP